MPGGGVVHIATATSSADGGTYVELSVADEGAGIDEAIRPHIFEPFFTTRHQAGGTGLGLATVLGTAEQHGGTVRVGARATAGTVFTIVLPAAAEDGATAQAARQLPLAAPKPGLRSLRLLVIDDETKVAEVTRGILETRGHAVYVTNQPEEALQIWASHQSNIDLVICDVVMARMRGPELVARMSEGGLRPRVLFMTGYSEEAVHAELGHPVLTKPFTADSLLAAIAEVLGSGG
jgi:CheY-like chemotaxis protein